MKKSNTKKIILGMVLLLTCLLIPLAVTANEDRVYQGYENQVEAGKLCTNEGESRCIDGEMIFRCQSGQWQPKEVCFWGCKTQSMCQI